MSLEEIIQIKHLITLKKTVNQYQYSQYIQAIIMIIGPVVFMLGKEYFIYTLIVYCIVVFYSIRFRIFKDMLEIIDENIHNKLEHYSTYLELKHRH